MSLGTVTDFSRSVPGPFLSQARVPWQYDGIAEGASRVTSSHPAENAGDLLQPACDGGPTDGRKLAGVMAIRE